jgi:hypothetical protein
MSAAQNLTIESFGIAPGPLDAYRGTGRVAKELGLLPKPSEPLVRQTAAPMRPDPALATITLKVSPCPCKSKECEEYYQRLLAGGR